MPPFNVRDTEPSDNFPVWIGYLLFLLGFLIAFVFVVGLLNLIGWV